jgi:hypothetical protein
MRVKLLSSVEPGHVLAVVEGPNVAEQTAELGTIGGNPWRANGSDFAYALLGDTPGLVDELKAEGYEVDASDLLERHNEERKG